MNRIDRLFREKNKNILNIYYTAGFPGLADTLPILETLEDSGADIAEVGIPFSDSLADGPVIQVSNAKALAGGMTVKLLFEQLATLRERVKIPVILMGSLNPVLQYGMEAFLGACSRVGVDGLILPDLPVEEYEKHYAGLFHQSDIHLIFLVTPETSEQRLRKIDGLTGGFLYAVSSSSTTGKNKDIRQQETYFQRLQQMELDHPVLVGFGIRDRNTFEAACSHTSGAVIGTAFINLLEAHPDDRDEAIRSFILQIKPS